MISLKEMPLWPRSVKQLLLTLSVVLPTLSVQGQITNERPRLVVFVTIDQLRTDYLESMLPALGDRGFKRLMREGFYCENINYEFPNRDRASATAALYTGTTPWYNGIISATIYNPQSKRVEPILFSPKTLGNYTTQTLSPQPLLTSTLCDELKVATEGRAQVYSIAPDADMAILSAGHTANAAFWLEESNGKWATSAYYKDIPWYVERYNITQSLSARIDTLAWLPVHQAGKYNLLQRITTKFAFRYAFSRAGDAKYRNFKSSGLVNEEVLNLATLFFEQGGLGQRSEMDMLNLGFYAGNYREKNPNLYGMELEDTYLRLDQSIAKLLDLIEKQVGLKNALVVVVSTGYFAAEEKEAGLYEIPTGEFYPNRAVSLLNMYLMALYGDGSWVEGYHDKQIYLNRKLIADKLIDPEEIETRSARFLVQMTGVQDVTSAHQLLHGNWNERIGAARNGYHRKRSGDLLLEIQPGWEIVYEDASQRREPVRHNAIPAPLFLLGKEITPIRRYDPVPVASLAPALSRCMRIRAPNAAGSYPLPLAQ